MVSFLRCCVGITLWMCFQSSTLASESSDIKKKAAFLPSSLSSKSQVIRVNPRYLITQERQPGETFRIPLDEQSAPSIPIDSVETIEVISDRQEYNEQSNTIIAEGNVVMRFGQSVMTSDRLEINLNDRLAVARDNVVLQRGEQVLRGERFEYYLVADRGVIYQAGGEIYQPSLGRDTDFKQQLAPEATILDRALSDRVLYDQPVTNVTGTEGIGATIGSTRDLNILDGNGDRGGAINRLRFEAERVDFEADSWTAENLSLTNDPFSPPELEVRAKTARFEQLDSLTGRLVTTKSRLVLDDSLAVPLLANRFVFDDRSSQPGLFDIAFDGDERGGLYLERSFNIIDRDKFSWSITPQYFLQRAVIPDAFEFNDEDEGGLFDSASYGLRSRINTIFTPTTDLSASLSITDFDFNELDDNLRARVGFEQRVGQIDNPYRFALEYNYRDRLFNGSLGFQTVRSSFGGVVTSPTIALGNTGVTFRYQGSIQNISADTDRADLLEANRNENRVNLTRYQGAAFVNKNFPLWRGEALASTQDAGLRYTPIPVVPYLDLFTGVSGVGSLYSNSDSQLSLEGSIGIRGQLGHFSRNWLDYTGFQLSYSQNLRGDSSPFLFDRLVDRRTLSLGISQQIYGPIRAGVQTTLNLNDGEEISTDYLLEYSRRTYNVALRYNPVLEIGSFSLRISGFNWQGNSQPFREQGITPVIQGVD